MTNQFSAMPKGKAALPLLGFLKAIDPDVQCERRFDWLFLPKTGELLQAEANICKVLIEHCRTTKSRHPKKAMCNPDDLFSDIRNTGRTRILEVDFYLPSLHIGLEFDERQHFTMERDAALAAYPNVLFPYDTARWSSLCSERIIDYDPPGRDWQRAFRDSVRDLRAREHSLPLLRLYYKDFNAIALDSGDAARTLKEFIQRFSAGNRNR